MAINTQSNKYTFIFATIVCLVCSILLSAVSEGLRKQQEINADLDVKKNILKAVKLKEPLHPKMKAEDVLKIYSEKIIEEVIDESGNVLEGRKPTDIKEGEKVYPIYIYMENDSVISYAYPVVGQGLWSALYGYFAVEPDAITVRGVTFYKHGETPGLGAEIEKDWFQDNFKGKTIWAVKENKLTPIIIAKGKATDQHSGDELNHYVDGITAATLTGNGVTDLLSRWINIYEPYFSKLRKI